MLQKYLSLVKFSHTIFALPFAFIGFFLGMVKIQGSIATYENFIKFILVMICMVSARSAAMAFNRYLDRNFDAKNPRTAIREIPAGIISPSSALRFTIFACLVFMTACFFINTICFLLAPVALFVILFYSFTKRFTSLCHLVLGLGLALAPIGAYLAVTGVFHILPILFSFTVLFWVSGFDIIYALQDVAFDQSQSLYSIPSIFGKNKALIISRGLHLLAAAMVILAGFVGDFHWIYWTGVLIFIGMLVYQQSIVSADNLSKVNIAFMTANGIASILFGCLVIIDLFLFTNL